MRILLLLVFVSVQGIAQTQIMSTRQLITTIQARYTGQACRTYTFVQHNTHYENGAEKGKSVWYEAIEYPGNFRIDFGEPSLGDAVIFARDSVYRFKEGKLVNKRRQPNDLLFLAAGWLYHPVDTVLARLSAMGYDPTQFSTTTWQGQAVYSIASPAGAGTQQAVYVSVDNLLTIGLKKEVAGKPAETTLFEAFTAQCGGYLESRVTFSTGGQPVQVEEYKDVKGGVALPAGLFDPAQFGRVHWYK